MKTRNSKRILAAALSLLLAAGAMAQQSNSKEINKIKRSTAYLYSEATMATQQEAAEVAYELLMKQVEEYIASKRKLNQADNVLIKDIRSKGEALSMMRGEMHRVFVYVKKSDIEGVENTTVVNAASGTTVTITDNPLLPPTAPVAATDHASEILPPPAPETEKKAPADEIADDGDHTPIEEFQPEDEAVQKRLATVGGAYLQDGKVQSDLPAWQQQAIAQLLDCGDITAVRAKLNRLKAQYKVKRFGPADKCPKPAEACWALFDTQGRLLTVLGPGTQNRIDYRSMQYSTLEAYKGMNAIWFNFSK